MTTRTFLVHGLLAGLCAGLLAFLVAHQVGEPHVEAAIALEESHSHQHEGTADEGHSHDEEPEVSRPTQRTFGLVTATLVVGTALGGLVGLVAAVAMGRLGRMTPAQSTATVTGIGFVSVALLPFLKYPAAPPAVGSGETIGERTSYYFVFLLVSVLTAVAATVLARSLWRRYGGYVAVVGGSGLYLAVMVASAVAMPAVNELGDFPADVLWGFRASSLFTLATTWAVIGTVLTGLVLRSTAEQSRIAARRRLAETI